MRIDEIMSGLMLELRRGTLVINVLSQLKEPEYGYSLLQKLENRGIKIEGNTLYPLLRRLEKQELLKSEWETNSSKPRKYYALTETGEAVFKELCKELESMIKNFETIIKEGEEK
ncbi:MAG: PadR family transcriptional regulator [Turicibacter sp.]